MCWSNIITGDVTSQSHCERDYHKIVRTGEKNLLLRTVVDLS